ncbi:tetratricopeptide repeat protein [Amylibacter sp. IMCC11727]|uniref:tetratricopeptide repeat protein n=1 Tax=Amylibacter sp. IMCC11727 TaxID=3039851 RepID=UPI00244E467C|nr:tetratricopeptide repeat protein [Amylibacter sp. IMCC11727]WGI20281.1 tetratricopeptide repeat protein [Amylibacter sp. IMCC11727]
MKFLPLVTATMVSLSVASGAFAAGDGGGSSKASKKKCEKKGLVYDKKTKKCVEASRGMFDDDFIYVNARAMAYDGQFQHAINLLQLAENQDDPRVLNYLGFANRKLGRTAIAMEYYARALAIDPDYILARSYMGQGLVADGDMAGAKAQLAEIRDRGHADSWAYVMLENAIQTTVTY